jgi:hypothetical protein
LRLQSRCCLGLWFLKTWLGWRIHFQAASERYASMPPRTYCLGMKIILSWANWEEADIRSVLCFFLTYLTAEYTFTKVPPTLYKERQKLITRDDSRALSVELGTRGIYIANLNNCPLSPTIPLFPYICSLGCSQSFSIVLLLLYRCIVLLLRCSIKPGSHHSCELFTTCCSYVYAPCIC